MSNLDMQILDVVNCLREEGFFSSEISDDWIPVIFPQAGWDDYYHVHPYWRPMTATERIASKKVKVSEYDFNSLESMLPETSRMKMLEKMEEIVPDNPDTVILEVGSASGMNGAGLLATSKPKAQIILMDRGWEDTQFPEYFFVKPRKGFKKLVFPESAREIAAEPDIEKRINGLYQAAGLTNVKFYEHRLLKNDFEELGLPGFLTELEGKNIYVMANRCPVALPFLVARLYNELGAKYMYVSLTAQEKIVVTEFSWAIVKQNLGLTESELNEFRSHVHDPHAEGNGLSEKYDYRDASQRRVGRTLKLAIALALAKEVDGQVLRHSNSREYAANYNQVDHFVEARRK